VGFFFVSDIFLPPSSFFVFLSVLVMPNSAMKEV
jgi:hypothetical protein